MRDHQNNKTRVLKQPPFSITPRVESLGGGPGRPRVTPDWLRLQLRSGHPSHLEPPLFVSFTLASGECDGITRAQ